HSAPRNNTTTAIVKAFGFFLVVLALVTAFDPTYLVVVTCPLTAVGVLLVFLRYIGVYRRFMAAGTTA
ncbi:MAG: hypothetical protein ACRYFY_16830, partial [Janthinobacterium lividum]